VQTRPLHNVHSAYENGLKLYLNIFDSIFTRAKNENEFEYILSILNVRGEQDAGWDGLENLRDIYKSYYKSKRKIAKTRASTHFSLFFYGIIFEADDLYDIIANMLNTIAGDGYRVVNFPSSADKNGRVQFQHPLDKTNQLKKWANKVDLDLSIYDELLDNELRNAVFHSKYTVYWPEIRLFDPPRIIPFEEWMTIINKALAYVEAFFKVLDIHRKQYSTPVIIEPSPGFTQNRDEKAITIIRNNYGVVGLKSHFQGAAPPEGYPMFKIGKFLPYEDVLMERGELILPSNKIEKINSVLRFLPDRVRRYIVKKIGPRYLTR